MNSTDADDDMVKWYQSLNKDHNKLRQELLSRLPDLYSMERPLPRDSKRTKHSRRSRYFAMAAALVFIMATVAIVVNSSGRPAFAIEAMLNRLASSSSVRLEGAFYEFNVETGENNQRLPFKAYLARPNYYWFTKMAVAEGKPTIATECSNGRIHISDRDGGKTIRSDMEMPAQIVVEEFLQFSMIDQLTPTSWDRFRFSDLANNSQLQLLEAEFTDAHGAQMRQRLLIDRSSQLPVRITLEAIDGGTSRLLMEIEEIAVGETVPTWARLEDVESLTGLEAVTHADGIGSLSTITRTATAGSASVSLLTAVHLTDGTVFAIGRIAQTDATLGARLSILHNDGTRADCQWSEFNQSDDEENSWRVWHIQPSNLINESERASLELSVSGSGGRAAVAVPILSLSMQSVRQLIRDLVPDFDLSRLDSY